MLPYYSSGEATRSCLLTKYCSLEEALPSATGNEPISNDSSQVEELPSGSDSHGDESPATGDTSAIPNGGDLESATQNDGDQEGATPKNGGVAAGCAHAGSSEEGGKVNPDTDGRSDQEDASPIPDKEPTDLQEVGEELTRSQHSPMKVLDDGLKKVSPRLPAFDPERFRNRYFEIRESPLSGLGAFARQDIQRGTTILVEEQLIQVKNWDIFDQLDNLTPHLREAYFRLHAYWDNPLIDRATAILRTNG